MRHIFLNRESPSSPKESDCSTLEVKLLSDYAKAPMKATDAAAGYDLYSAVNTIIQPRKRALVNTDIVIALPEGCYGHIAPRSGNSIHHGVETGGGVVDRDYRDPVRVILFNHDKNNEFEVRRGNKIAQLIVERIADTKIEIIDSLDMTVHDDKGFGSTRINQISHIGAIGTENVAYLTSPELLRIIDEAQSSECPKIRQSLFSIVEEEQVKFDDDADATTVNATNIRNNDSSKSTNVETVGRNVVDNVIQVETVDDNNDNNDEIDNESNRNVPLYNRLVDNKGVVNVQCNFIDHLNYKPRVISKLQQLKQKEEEERKLIEEASDILNIIDDDEIEEAACKIFKSNPASLILVIT